MAAMGEMIENIAHQWRQPLSMISTNVTGLQLKKEYNQLDEDTLDDILVSIHEATKHLSQTIDDFRSFFENDKSAETFKLLNIIEKSIFLTSSKFNNRAIIVKLECPDIEITGLPNELVQILMNILNNAKDQLEKIPTTELRLLVIEGYKDSEVVQINITDNGGGVEEEILPKIFDAYITSKGKDGTGIGLYMSKIMVESHMKGTLRVINKEFKYEGKMHKGACFNIQLPLNT
jgi:signal transduction histidine kinase